MASKFCTCADKKCPLNPANHNKGCDLCIQKNLKNREIPNCFYALIDMPEGPEGYTLRDFAQAVLRYEDSDQ